MLALAPSLGNAQSTVHHVDQGKLWKDNERDHFYTQDQGSQMMLLSWLKALKLPNRMPFFDGSLARYGYLPNPPSILNPNGLPVGFTSVDTAGGTMVGMTCAACHTRQVIIDREPYRIDGGPAIVNFEGFLTDLDASTRNVLVNPSAFHDFAVAVVGTGDDRDPKVAMLRADLTVWSTRYHMLMTQSQIDGRSGPARIDAVSLIFNRLAGLDIGRPATHAIPENIAVANAPTRYPFLWNASRQNRTQWPGFAPNGTPIYALSRNLGEVYGVFGLFHPQDTKGTATLLNRAYLIQNSGNFPGLFKLEHLIQRIGPPSWQWAIDPVKAAKGKTIYETVATGPDGHRATCADCHGIHPTGPDNTLWNTPVVDVGTDHSEWHVLARHVDTGVLQGASLPGKIDPLAREACAATVLTLSVAGAISQQTTLISSAPLPTMPTPGAAGFGDASAAEGGVRAAAAPIAAAASLPITVTTQMSTLSLTELDALVRAPCSVEGIAPNSYESRVLEGIWAAAPYLHNGSVPTLWDLLQPAAQRPQLFPVGPYYDVASNIGLASGQPGTTFQMRTTSCDGIDSGNSNCGHEYGTGLPQEDKRALLEYLKTL